MKEIILKKWDSKKLNALTKLKTIQDAVYMGIEGILKSRGYYKSVEIEEFLHIGRENFIYEDSFLKLIGNYADIQELIPLIKIEEC